MANKETDKLAADVRALAEKLGVPQPSTDGLSTQQLTEKLADLRRQEATQKSGTMEPRDATARASTPDPTVTQTAHAPVLDGEAKKAEDAQAAAARGSFDHEAVEQEAETSGYIVAEGKSVTTLRGIVEAGRGISPKDFSGGQERLDQLVKSGILARKGEQTKPEPDTK